MTDVVNILHLSDLHFGDESITDAARRKNVLDKLIGTLKDVDNKWKPQLVVISGDIGWTGSREDYELAKTWLKNLLESLDLTAKELIICAGNHDIDLNEADFLVTPDNNQDADRYLQLENLKRFTSPFKNYISFCNDLGIQPLNLGEENSFLVGSRKTEELQFVVLNSAWFFRRKKKRELWIGLPQIQLMKANRQLVDDQVISIAIMHHPPECLHEEETNSFGTRLNTYEYLSRYCSLVFSGHVHGALKKCDQKYENAFLFTGGSSYSGDRVRNNFSLYQVNRKQFTVTRKPYGYDPADMKWSDNKNYEIVINLKEMRIVKKEAQIEDLHHTLFNGSKKYHDALTGVNGRFKHLKIADTILSQPENEWIETRVSVDGDNSLNVLSALPVLWKKECKHTVIVGEGGLGKTVSLIRLWDENTQIYEPGKPVPIFIALNEYNQASDTSDRNDFIISMIKDYYLDDSVSDADVWEAMKTPIKDEIDYVPSMVLLLDGFNEITVEKRELLIELRKIIEQSRGVQIVISSRYDMRATFNWNEFNLLSLLKLGDSQVESYLYEQHMPVPEIQEVSQNRLRMLIKNPMMLTIYAATCEVVTNHRDDKRCSFKEHIKTPGELLWNFMESQVAKFLDRDGMKEGNKWFYKFLLKFLLPAIGYEMEKAGQFELSRDKMNEVIDSYCIRFYHDNFFKAFPEYGKYEDDLNLGEFDDNKEKRRRRSRIIEILSEELIMMVNEGSSYRFLHQNFRDFFAAVHILNEVSIGLKEDEVTRVLKESTISLYVRRYMGEIEGEHYCKPFLVKDKGWEIKENKDSLIYKVLNLCRGTFDKSNGFAVWNIIEIWKDVRGELSGADLSHLDLSSVILNGVRCSRFYKDKYLSAIFDSALLLEKNIFPQGHLASINSATYSQDGKRILSASDDHTIKEWDIDTTICSRTFRGHSHWVSNVVYSPDGKKILSASFDNTIREWDVETGKCTKTYQIHSGIVKSVIWKLSGKIILSAKNHTIKEWNMDTGASIKNYKGHYGSVSRVVYSTDGKRILSASHDKTIREWDRKTGHCKNIYFGHTAVVISAVYSSDCKKILSASTDKTIKEWDTKTGKCLKTLHGHSEPVNIALYSYDGQKILSASYDHTIREWDVETGKCINKYIGNSEIKSLLYSASGKKILSAFEDRTIKEWDTDTGECIKTYHGHLNKINKVVYHRDGKKILYASADNAIKEWDIETGECLKIYHGHSRAVNSAIYSEDSKKILSVSILGTIKEWDIENGECLTTYKEVPVLLPNALYSHDGRKIFLTSYENKKLRVQEWDAETGIYLGTYIKENLESLKTQKIIPFSRKKNSNNTIEIENCVTGRHIMTIQNIYGLFIQHCSFKNLHPGSELSDESIESLKHYGGKF